MLQVPQDSSYIGMTNWKENKAKVILLVYAQNIFFICDSNSS